MSVCCRYLALLTFGCLPAAYAYAAFSPAPAARPNVLLIVADDLGYADVGFHGSKEIPTPHLDALARRGVICTSGYVTYSVCSPSRAGFITGRYQQRFGYEYNPAFDLTNAEQGLPLTERTLADRLRAAGYATGIVGKWHLGAHPQFHPNRRGFDEFFGLLGGGHRYFPDGPVTIEIAAGRKTSDPQAQAEVGSEDDVMSRNDCGDRQQHEHADATNLRGHGQAGR